MQSKLGVGCERGVQQRVERARVDRRDRLRLRHQALVDGVDGEAHRRLGGALGAARLQHVQTSLLDRELGVLHVLVVALQVAQDLAQLHVDGGHPVAELREVARRAHARHDVLALGVRDEVAAGLGRAGDLVARERDARAGGVARVAEHHLLDVDRGAPVVRNALDAPVGDRPLARPGVEDGEDRAPQLLARVAREVVEGAEAAGELAQRVGVEVGVEPHVVLALDGGDLILEALAGHAADHVAEHLHQAAIGVPREPVVAGARREPRDGVVVEPEVEDRVHHPRHRVARAAAHGDQQRVLRIREPLAGLFLESCQRLVDGVVEPLRATVGTVHVGDARLGGDREAGRNELRAEHARHLRDVGALAAEQVAHLARALREVVDPPGGGRCAHVRSSPVASR